MECSDSEYPYRRRSQQRSNTRCNDDFFSENVSRDLKILASSHDLRIQTFANVRGCSSMFDKVKKKKKKYMCENCSHSYVSVSDGLGIQQRRRIRMRLPQAGPFPAASGAACRRTRACQAALRPGCRMGRRRITTVGI